MLTNLFNFSSAIGLANEFTRVNANDRLSIKFHSHYLWVSRLRTYRGKSVGAAFRTAASCEFRAPTATRRSLLLVKTMMSAAS